LVTYVLLKHRSYNIRQPVDAPENYLRLLGSVLGDVSPDVDVSPPRARVALSYELDRSLLLPVVDVPFEGRLGLYGS
jgi:hypothetical protein